MSEEEKQMFNKMIYCNLINGEQALKFNRKYEDLQQKVEQLENIRKEAIEYIEKSMNNTQPFYQYLFGDENGKVENLDKLLNILNKGSENDAKKNNTNSN